MDCDILEPAEIDSAGFCLPDLVLIVRLTVYVLMCCGSAGRRNVHAAEKTAEHEGNHGKRDICSSVYCI